MVSLYRHFDSNSKLLYVGISQGVMTRTYSHERKSEWFDQVVRIEIEHYATEEAARNAEKVAIKNEHPIFNLTHNVKIEKPSIKITEKDVQQYPLVVAERERISKLYNQGWSLNWIAGFFGTEVEIIKHVLGREIHIIKHCMVPNIAKPAFEDGDGLGL